MNMNEQIKPKPSPLAVFSAVAFAITTCVFAYLYFEEKARPLKVENKIVEVPVEVVKEVEKKVEVPVEVIKEIEKRVEVPVEVIKKVEIPAKFDETQKTFLVFGTNYLTALQKPVLESGKAFGGIPQFQVNIHINNAIEKLISKETIQNKFELSLRKSGLKLDDDATHWINLEIEGIEHETSKLTTYVVTASLSESAVLIRTGEMRKFIVTSWSKASFGYAGSSVIRDAIDRNIETSAEAVANTFLKTQNSETSKQTR